MMTKTYDNTRQVSLSRESELQGKPAQTTPWTGNAWSDLQRGKPQWDGVERRESDDRRTYTLKTLYQCAVSPRRFNGRRKSDRRFAVLDRFDSGMAFFAIGLVVLSIMDSVFTLTLIAHGGTEVNPFMNWLLHISVSAFIGVKMLLTAIPAVILVATGNVLVFGKIRARSILGAALGLYCGLIIYELGLLSLIP